MLTLETSALKLHAVTNLCYHVMGDKTKLLCYTLLPTQYHSFFRKLSLYTFDIYHSPFYKWVSLIPFCNVQQLSQGFLEIEVTIETSTLTPKFLQLFNR